MSVGVQAEKVDGESLRDRHATVPREVAPPVRRLMVARAVVDEPSAPAQRRAENDRRCAAQVNRGAINSLDAFLSLKDEPMTQGTHRCLTWLESDPQIDDGPGPARDRAAVPQARFSARMHH